MKSVILQYDDNNRLRTACIPYMLTKEEFDLFQLWNIQNRLDPVSIYTRVDITSNPLKPRDVYAVQIYAFVNPNDDGGTILRKAERAVIKFSKEYKTKYLIKVKR